MLQVLAFAQIASAQKVTGELRAWHAVTLTFDGPKASETGEPNPFRDYRLLVTFDNGDQRVRVPGYFAADGNAGETSAATGNKWRALFVPPRAGKWTYRASFRTGKDIAVDESATAGKPASFDGAAGTLSILPTNKSGRDHRAKGRLRYVGKRYLQFAENKEYFLKGGADSPENLLAFVDFDDTYVAPRKKGPRKKLKLHEYGPHVKDWRDGDPTWKNGKGKGLIGALNYLADKGMNSVYFLTMNVTGDGNDVWPWVKPDVRDRFDCSKLDQWNVVFDHADRKGIVLHVITQETENDQLLDGGELGLYRKLYYRELVARFGHHLAVVWNLGEECSNTTKQIKSFSDYFKRIDPYDGPVVVHTFPNAKEKVYAPLLGHKSIDGPSLQFSADWDRIPGVVNEWVTRSAKAGHPWVVCIDEPGTAKFGLDHDAKKENNNQTIARKTALWGALLAGGSGVEWYFGYANPHHDLNCEDWRSRDRMWARTRHALAFFQKQVPFHEMTPRNDLVQDAGAQCFAKPGATYVIYLPRGGEASLDLGASKKRHDVRWYDPRNGGELMEGMVKEVTGPGKVKLGAPPRERDQDWVVRIKTR